MNQYEHLVGKSKKQVVEILGHDFNYFPDKIWKYELKKNWIGQKTVLVVYFNSEIVSKVEIKKTFL